MLGWLEPLELDMNCYTVKVLKMRLDKKTFDKRDVFPSELLSKKNVICWTFLKVMVKLFIDE